MISDTVIIALATSTLAPTILLTVQLIAQRAKTRAEWKRQDEVSERVAWAAKLLESNTSHTNGMLDELHAGQKQIHTLVNSNLTAEMQARKDSMVRELAVLREMAAMKTKANDKPFPETMQAIKSVKGSLAELSAQLQDRLAATQKGETEAKQ